MAVQNKAILIPDTATKLPRTRITWIGTGWCSKVPSSIFPYCGFWLGLDHYPCSDVRGILYDETVSSTDVAYLEGNKENEDDDEGEVDDEGQSDDEEETDSEQQFGHMAPVATDEDGAVAHDAHADDSSEGAAGAREERADGDAAAAAATGCEEEEEEEEEEGVVAASKRRKRHHDAMGGHPQGQSQPHVAQTSDLQLFNPVNSDTEGWIHSRLTPVLDSCLPLNLIDLCSGAIGAFSLAWHRLGHGTTGFADVDQHRIEYFMALEARKDAHLVGEGDVWKIRPEELTQLSPFMLSAGFPCQSFSSAGCRASVNSDDLKGLLGFRIVLLARYVQPPTVLLENVKDLLDIGLRKPQTDGATLRHLVQRLEEAGYIVFVFLVNAQWVGIPQNRNRVLIAGP